MKIFGIKESLKILGDTITLKTLDGRIFSENLNNDNINAILTSVSRVMLTPQENITVRFVT
jgi:hypothetical protein